MRVIIKNYEDGTRRPLLLTENEEKFLNLLNKWRLFGEEVEIEYIHEEEYKGISEYEATEETN